MYAKIQNDQVIEYPYSAAELRRDYPETSFPADPISDSILAYFNVYPVAASGSSSFDQATQRLEQGTPIKQNNIWTQNWIVIDLSSSEVEQLRHGWAQSARIDRNQRLAACDWTQVNDSPVDKTAWAEYRQALRDISLQAAFPYSIEWPVQPY